MTNIEQVIEWLKEDKDRIWEQSRPHPNRFGSNKRDAVYVFDDHILYWEDYHKPDKFTKHEFPKSKLEFDKILTKNPATKMPKRSGDTTKSVSDEFGNLLISRTNGKRVLISLKLVAEKRPRKIGTINIAQKTIDMERVRNKHLFRKSNSYGFNHNLLKKTLLFDKVRLRDDQNEWLIPKDFILENGHFLNFKNQGGFELQIFLPLEMMEQFKRNPKI